MKLNTASTKVIFLSFYYNSAPLILHLTAINHYTHFLRLNDCKKKIFSYWPSMKRA